MSITSGCNIPDSQAYCAILNYLSDVSAMCSLGLVWNAAYNTRVGAIALAALSTLKIGMAAVNLTTIKRNINLSHNFLGSQIMLNLALLIIGGLTTLAAGMSKTNASWIRTMWNDEIKDCVGQKKREGLIASTPSPACMANPSWNIIHSENVTCCYSKALEQQWKSTYTPIMPVVFAVAGLGLIFFMMISECVINRPADARDSETRPINAAATPAGVSSTRVVLAVCNIVMAVLLLGSTLGTTVTSFSYKYCLPDWVNQNLNVCICDSPR